MKHKRMTSKEIRSLWNNDDTLNKKGEKYLNASIKSLEACLKDLDVLGIDTDFSDAVREVLDQIEWYYIEDKPNGAEPTK